MNQNAARSQNTDLLGKNLEKLLALAPEFLAPRQQQSESPVMGPFRWHLNATTELIRPLRNADLHVLADASIAEINEHLASLFALLQGVRPLIQHNPDDMTARQN